MAIASDGTNIYIQGGYTTDYEIGQVNQTDWKKIRKFDTENETLVKLGRPGGGSYTNRALMEMVNYNGKFYLFSGADVRREYSMDHNNLYSTWMYDTNSNSWTLDSAGCGYGPRHGYTAEVFDAGDGEKIWIIGGWSYTGPKDDVWSAEVED